jgi:hypothetical protein
MPQNDSKDDIHRPNPRRRQRTSTVSSDLSPIQGQRKQRHSARQAEDLIDNDVVGRHPRYERKCAQRGEHVSRYEVPDARSCHDAEEEFISRDDPAVRRVIATVVKSFEECRCRDDGGPSHGLGVDEPSATESG